MQKTTSNSRDTGKRIDYDSQSDPSTPDLARTLPKAMTIVFYVQEIDCDYSRNYPSPPDLTRTLPKPKITLSKESIATISEMIRALRTLSEFSDFVRTLPKDRNTVFGVFLHIFRCEESIAAIPEMIRALPTFPEL
ncbi:hypothetical protein NQ317_007427 [Molorchus minor]|uniref:Uncharacterized protein n=1 Tax=Molorchus minor TaxID=1323400 RepID=A0ABQ9JGU1_9CUCU|nr:hypothetical protein NQ317_007427 [Molorchus minor]